MNECMNECPWGVALQLCRSDVEAKIVKLYFNPRPDTVFRHLGRTGGGVGATPLGVSKRSVVELSGKDQQIALAEYSRLVVLFCS